MKIRFQYIILLCVLVGGITSCEKDNYDPPSITLSGRLVYNGEPIGVEYSKVSFELYQPGYGKTGPLPEAFFAPDGSYSALLFEGNYKLTIPDGQGPFMWKKTAAGAPDSLSIALNGDQKLDLEVTPYYMIRTPQITFSAGKVNAAFKLEKVITDANAKDIQMVTLYISKTAFAEKTTNIGEAEIAGADITDVNNVTLSVAVPAMVPAQNFVYARIGVQIAGVADLIFSPLQKISVQ